MSRPPNPARSNSRPDNGEFFRESLSYESNLASVAARFDRGYRQQDLELPAEIQQLPLYSDWTGGTLTEKLVSPFWKLARPLKNQHCLDLGCGLSFLIYPWRDWGAYFYGQEISAVARDVLVARGPQLNSKLFKGVQLAPAHRLDYPPSRFDLVIATGWSAYFPTDYWRECVEAVKGVLKPGGDFVFDLLDPDRYGVEDWALLETYLGAEVFLEPLTEREKAIEAAGGKIVARESGEFYQLYKVRFPDRTD